VGKLDLQRGRGRKAVKKHLGSPRKIRGDWGVTREKRGCPSADKAARREKRERMGRVGATLK